MPIKFYYHPQSPASQAVWMILKELGLEYDEEIVDLLHGEQKSEGYRAINPFQKVPAIVDGELTLAESRAIAIYLCTKYEPQNKENKIYPKDEIGIARMNMRIFRDTENLNTLSRYTNGEAIFMGKAAGPVKELSWKVRAVLAEMNEILSKSKYFWGDHLTVLDFFALNSTSILLMVDFGPWDKYPHLLRWRETMKELPYYEECHGKPLEACIEMFRKKLEAAAKR